MPQHTYEQAANAVFTFTKNTILLVSSHATLMVYSYSHYSNSATISLSLRNFKYFFLIFVLFLAIRRRDRQTCAQTDANSAHFHVCIARFRFLLLLLLLPASLFIFISFSFPSSIQCKKRETYLITKLLICKTVVSVVVSLCFFSVLCCYSIYIDCFVAPSSSAL